MTAAAGEVRYDVGGWISGPQLDELKPRPHGECGNRKATVAGGLPWLWCCLDAAHVAAGELHESADFEWSDGMLFARLKGV